MSPALSCRITTPCLLVLLMLYMTNSGMIWAGCRTSSSEGSPKMVCKLGRKRAEICKGWRKTSSFHFYSKTLGELKCCLITSHFQEDNWGHFSLGQTATFSKEEHLRCLKYISAPAPDQKFLKCSNPKLINRSHNQCKQHGKIQLFKNSNSI